MPKARRSKPIYQRGPFALHPRAGRNHEIVWYDEHRKRERCLSAGTKSIDAAKQVLDNFYVGKFGGVPCCPTCKRPLDQRAAPISVLVANYLERQPAKSAVHPRLAHVLDYVEAQGTIPGADAIDEQWVQSFRDWMRARTDRDRAPGTIENSLIQLASAMRAGGVRPKFRPLQTSEVNRTPTYRASIETIAAMFRYCLMPEGARTDKEAARRRRERENLLRFLRVSVATWARPDAAHEVSTSPARRQWISEAKVLALNPDGRKQTRKRRAIVPIARQFAPHLDECEGPYITVSSVKSAWEAMALELKLPAEGASGMKLIRRSIMTEARRRLGEEHWVQGRMMAGHMKDTISDVYAIPSPTNFGRALAVTEAVIDEIEVSCPGAFYSDFTARSGNLLNIGASKND